MAYKPCVNSYYKDIEKVRGIISAVPGIYDGVANTLTFFFPFPFQLGGLAKFSSMPSSGSPSFNGGGVYLDSTANQNTYGEMVLAMFIAFGFANAQMQGVSNGSTAYASTKFSEYMNNYLNTKLQPAYFNTFIAPGNAVLDFWGLEAAHPAPSTLKDRFNALLSFINENAFKPLYGAPGKYIINLANTNTEPYYTKLMAYLAANGNNIAFYVGGFNAFSLIDDAPGNPLTNTIDSINFDTSNPDAILWDAGA